MNSRSPVEEATAVQEPPAPTGWPTLGGFSVGQEAHAPAAPPAQLASIALMLLPGALIVALGFNAGGYFPAAPAAATLLIAQILLVRILRSSDPLEGISRTTLLLTAALGVYGALTLASALWSHALGRALIEFNRASLYLLVLVLFATVPAKSANVRWLIRGVLLGCSIVCVAGLISRVAPDVWHTAPDVANERLSFPVTYWNALGLLAALGIVFALHLTCSLAERRLVQVLSAAVLPLLAATLFFTFSRGAIGTGVIGVAAYMLLGRPRGLLGGVLSVAPGTAALILVAYHANLLDTVDPTTPAAVAQGHRVALAAVICVAACAGTRLLPAHWLDPRLGRRPTIIPGGRVAGRSATGAAGAVAIAACLALGVPQALAHDWNRFFSGVAPHGNHGDLRQRLTDPSNNGRSDLWRVALDGFSSDPLHGSGAGTYQTVWDHKRSRSAFTVNAHSLYLQSMAELGVPGLALLIGLVGGVLVGLAARARGSRRSLYGALFAAGLVWALHAGVDWDWEMPVVTVPFFAAAGLALGSGKRRLSTWVPSSGARLALALPCVAAAVLPVLIIGSQTRLDEAKRALYASNCTKAVPAAQASIGWLSERPQPYEILGLCEMQRRRPRVAVTEMRKALSRDPRSWEAYYMLAIAQAAAGIDPRATAARALRMNPLEPLTREAVRKFRGSSPRRWAEQALTVRAAALSSNHLSIVPS
jgi:O-antigen ligase